MIKKLKSKIALKMTWFAFRLYKFLMNRFRKNPMSQLRYWKDLRYNTKLKTCENLDELLNRMDKSGNDDAKYLAAMWNAYDIVTIHNAIEKLGIKPKEKEAE